LRQLRNLRIFTIGLELHEGAAQTHLNRALGRAIGKQGFFFGGFQQVEQFF
jgi:hypothetical protein